MKAAISIFLALNAFAFVVGAAVTVNITLPSPNQIVGDSLQVNVSVSSTFEVTNVVAGTSGRQTHLRTSGPSLFTGVVALSGVPSGPNSLVVTATDAFGNTGSAQ